MIDSGIIWLAGMALGAVTPSPAQPPSMVVITNPPKAESATADPAGFGSNVPNHLVFEGNQNPFVWFGDSDPAELGGIRSLARPAK